MNNTDFDIKTKLIKETFNDELNIKYDLFEKEPQMIDDFPEEIDIYVTENEKIICLDILLNDFDVEQLTQYIEIAETLYEKQKKSVSIYLLCPPNINVCVKECELRSEAEFSIKLARIEENPCSMILDKIKNKMNNDEILDYEDVNALLMLPVMCEKKDRHYYRKESIRILNEINY